MSHYLRLVLKAFVIIVTQMRRRETNKRLVLSISNESKIEKIELQYKVLDTSRTVYGFT